MNQEKYIGMDVHQATISVAVMEGRGMLIMECILETKASTILEFIQGLQGIQESKLFEELFEQIVRQCVEVGLVQGENLSVDGSFVEANAAKESRIPRQQLSEAAQVNHTVKQYLVDLEQQNSVEEPVHQQDQVSTTDPDSTYATKGGTPARLGYYDIYLVDNHSCVIVGVQATAARMSQETV